MASFLQKKELRSRRSEMPAILAQTTNFADFPACPGSVTHAPRETCLLARDLRNSSDVMVLDASS